VDLRPHVDASGVRASAPLPTLMLLLLVNTLALCCVLLLLLATGCSGCSIVSPLRSQVVVVVSPSCREMATTDGVVSAATVGKLSTIERVVKSECVRPSVRLSVTFAAAPAVELFRSSPAPSCAAPTERIATSLTDGVCLSLGL